MKPGSRKKYFRQTPLKSLLPRDSLVLPPHQNGLENRRPAPVVPVVDPADECRALHVANEPPCDVMRLEVVDVDRDDPAAAQFRHRVMDRGQKEPRVPLLERAVADFRSKVNYIKIRKMQMPMQI